MTQGVRVEPVTDASALDRFIAIPKRLYRGQRGFVAPLALERKDALSAKKNPYFHHAEAQYFVAYSGDEPVGRVSAQIDRLYIERYRNATGHFGLIDAPDDAAVWRALTGAAESWLRERGMRRAVGPLSLSTNEETGMLVDGFDAPPMMLMTYHPPYAARRLEEQGYVKAKDLIAYDYDVERTAPITDAKILARAGLDASRIRIRRLDMKRYKEELAIVLDIFNDAWSDNWGYVPMTAAEIEHTARSMKPLIEPELFWIAEIDGEPASMIVCLPNLNEALKGLEGNLLPFGWAKLLWRLKVSKVKTSRVVLFGLRKKHQRSIIGSAVILRILDALRLGGRKIGMPRAELSWILEDNVPMRKIIEKVGGKAYKTYRVYEKAIG
ncbi:MAG: dATP pyrophosphohydrolase [Hyphomicrobium sp.]|uniref:dATP pyrophosphohydrolase n=1 Tax=Hyphomicrobium sp. TaxID=82 RepID=UPI003D0A9985